MLVPRLIWPSLEVGMDGMPAICAPHRAGRTSMVRIAVWDACVDQSWNK